MRTTFSSMAVLAMSLLAKDVVASPIRMRDVSVEINEDVQVVKEADGSLQTTGTILSTETVTNGGQAPATSAAAVAVSSPAVFAEKEAVKPAVTSAAAAYVAPTSVYVAPTSAYVAPTTAAKPTTTSAAAVYSSKPSSTAVSSAAASSTASSSTSGGKKGLLFDYWADSTAIASFIKGDSSAASVYSWSSSWCPEIVSAFPTNIEQVPQLWGLRTQQNGGTEDVKNFDAAAGKSSATHYMGFNEPDQCGGGGSCITVTDAQTGWAAFATKYHGKKTLVSPSVTNGDVDGSTPKGLPWLKQFLQGSGIDSTVDAIGIHWYGGSDNDVNGACTNLLSQIDAAKVVAGSNRNVWLTEFQYQGTDVQGFLKTCVPQLDQKAGLDRYSYNLAGGLISSIGKALASI